LSQANGIKEEGSGSGDTEATETTTRVYSDDLAVRCKEIKAEVSIPFARCCRIPKWLASDEDYAVCKKIVLEYEQKANESDRSGCIYNVCLYIQMGILKFETDHDDKERPIFDLEGMIQSFLSYVSSYGMDGKWESIVRRVVNQCFDDLKGIVWGMEQNCFEQIPRLLHKVEFCSFKQLFTNCPDYSNDEKCSINMQYIRECYPKYVKNREIIFETEIVVTPETTSRAYSDDPSIYNPSIKRCQELETKISIPFPDCCQIPDLEFDDELDAACIEDLREYEQSMNTSDVFGCFYKVCLYKKMGILKFETDHADQVRPIVDPERIIQSFLVYLREYGMDERWEPIIRRAVNRCFDDLKGTVKRHECSGKFPILMRAVRMCSWKKLFMNCPDYSKDEQCSINLEYIRECWPKYVLEKEIIFETEIVITPKTTYQVYSDDPVVIRCRELEKKAVRPFKFCCELPMWEINNEVVEACIKKNLKKCDLNDRCCLFPCYYKELGLTQFIIDPFVRPNFNPEAVIQMYLYNMRDREMDGIWEPIIRRSVNRCFDDFEGAAEGYRCNETIPKILDEVKYCAIKEQFLACPDYSKDDQCSYNLEYMRECWADLDMYRDFYVV
jgi:hypothetical protein